MNSSKQVPMLSIIIPIYNVEKYIEQCLRSIAGQTYKDFEVLMIDDGSTDGSANICKFFTTDKRFVYVYKENGGVSSARNMGLDMARGKYLSFVDPDDVLEFNMYEVMIESLERINADFVQCKTRVLKDSGEYNMIENQGYDFLEALSLYYGVEDISNSNDEVLTKICNKNYNCLSWGKVYKRELWGDARYPIELSLGEDMATVVPYLLRQIERLL